MSKLSLYDLVGDLVLYRNLDPVDARLPQFADAWAEIGLADATRPRKHEASYARTTAWYLRRARALDRRAPELAELVYLGDTAMADGNTFKSLRAVTGWPGWAFIGAEKDEELAVIEKDGVYVANRWSALAEFASLLLAQGAALDARTAVVVDIDKTALGARGRNDRSIEPGAHHRHRDHCGRGHRRFVRPRRVPRRPTARSTWRSTTRSPRTTKTIWPTSA